MAYHIESTSTPAPIALAADRHTLVAIVKHTVKIVKLEDGTVVAEFKDADYLHNKVACFQNFIGLANSNKRWVQDYFTLMKKHEFLIH